MVDIFIARHGQNEDNANNILNGHRDLPLTELGRQQARELGKGIVAAGLQFDVIYCSPLSRAYQSAVIVSNILGLRQAPTHIEDLIERDFGTMTGQPIEKIKEMCSPDIIETDTITYFLNPPGAETFPEAMERALRAITKVRELQNSGKALLVCHGDIGKMVYAAETAKDWKKVLVDFHFGNGDLIEITPNDNAHVIKLSQYNL